MVGIAKQIYIFTLESCLLSLGFVLFLEGRIAGAGVHAVPATSGLEMASDRRVGFAASDESFIGSAGSVAPCSGTPPPPFSALAFWLSPHSVIDFGYQSMTLQQGSGDNSSWQPSSSVFTDFFVALIGLLPWPAEQPFTSWI